MSPVDPRIALAARNNAEWCDAVTRSWGEYGTFGPELWINSGAAPTFYPNAVTLVPMDWVPQALAEAADGFAVKDSFARLDLAPLHYTPLFEAMWIWSEPKLAPRSADATWRVVRDAASLSDWHEAWGGTEPTPFRPALLEEPDHAFIAAELAGRIVAGCVASRSEAVVGLSNLFGPADLAAGCLAGVQDFAPGLPVVGYEAGPALEGMKSLGFQALGPLRVWVREPVKGGNPPFIPSFRPRIDVWLTLGRDNQPGFTAPSDGTQPWPIPGTCPFWSIRRPRSRKRGAISPAISACCSRC